MHPGKLTVAALVAVITTTSLREAHAQNVDADPLVPTLDADWRIDGAITVGALAVTALAPLLSVDTTRAFDSEPFWFDNRVRDNFSATAAKASDVGVALSVAMPVAAFLGQGWDAQTQRTLLVHGESLALTLALNNVVKHAVGRPRPYVYNRDPDVLAYALREETDSHLSFYSGHAALAFASAVSGAYLFAGSSDDVAARTTIWSTGLFLAGATANLRVRAGKHFYSDVITGAVVGATTGWLVPYLHFGDQAPSLSTPEWIAIAAAPVAGAVVSQLLPLSRDVVSPLGETAPRVHAQVVPWATDTGGGLMVAGVF